MGFRFVEYAEGGSFFVLHNRGGIAGVHATLQQFRVSVCVSVCVRV